MLPKGSLFFSREGGGWTQTYRKEIEGFYNIFDVHSNKITISIAREVFH